MAFESGTVCRMYRHSSRWTRSASPHICPRLPFATVFGGPSNDWCVPSGETYSLTSKRRSANMQLTQHNHARQTHIQSSLHYHASPQTSSRIIYFRVAATGVQSYSKLRCRPHRIFSQFIIKWWSWNMKIESLWRVPGLIRRPRWARTRTRSTVNRQQYGRISFEGGGGFIAPHLKKPQRLYRFETFVEEEEGSRELWEKILRNLKYELQMENKRSFPYHATVYTIWYSNQTINIDERGPLIRLWICRAGDARVGLNTIVVVPPKL